VLSGLSIFQAPSCELCSHEWGVIGKKIVKLRATTRCFVMYRLTNCQVMVCYFCIQKWFSQQMLCPFCRTQKDNLIPIALTHDPSLADPNCPVFDPKIHLSFDDWDENDDEHNTSPDESWD
jgi:hypothetical protein